MNNDSDHRTQIIACFLIVISLIAVAVADHWNWRDLANAGNTVLGFGGGLLTGKFLSQISSKTDEPTETKITTQN